uniref:Uncharacterized protein n=1 Tax=Anolis carolinensis TaxID=28377 RepID=A0A803TNP8_ANOCA
PKVPATEKKTLGCIFALPLWLHYTPIFWRGQVAKASNDLFSIIIIIIMIFMLSNVHVSLVFQAGSVLSLGMGMFCGAFYYHALTGDPTFTKAAPYGGGLLILGWLAMAP